MATSKKDTVLPAKRFSTINSFISTLSLYHVFIKHSSVKIFTERCGLPANITFSYKEQEDSKYRKQSDKKMELEIAAIVDRIKENEESTPENKQNDDNSTAKDNKEDGKALENKSEDSSQKSQNAPKETKENKAPQQKSSGFDNKNGYYRREKAKRDRFIDL